MSIFILHQHPKDTDGDRLICLPDRFNWFAALLPPLWAGVNGLWRVLALMILAIAILVGLDAFFFIPTLLLYVLLAVFLGFEANHIHSMALARKGWGAGTNIIAPDTLLAEKDYFSKKTPSDEPPIGAETAR